MTSDATRSDGEEPGGDKPHLSHDAGGSRPDWLGLVVDAVCDSRRCPPGKALDDVVLLAVELAHEGREGRKVGALFVVGDCDAVLAKSRALLLDPLAGHPRELRDASRRELRETVKELTQIDGAFVVDDDGTFVAAGRLIATDFSAAEVPLGLGARHAAAASISGTTNAIAVALSQSSIVRVFSHGELRAEISPKLFVGTAQSSFSLEWPRIHELAGVGLTVAVAGGDEAGERP